MPVKGGGGFTGIKKKSLSNVNPTYSVRPLRSVAGMVECEGEDTRERDRETREKSNWKAKVWEGTLSTL